MSKGTAIVAIVIALIGGFMIGHLVGAKSGDNEDVAELEVGAEDGAGAGAEGGESDRYRVPVTDAQPSKGPKDALVTIVEVSDFECPFCSRVLPTVSQIMNEYRGKVRIVWRNNPLPFHQEAMPAAIAAMEAHAQGGNEKFWRMHDLLFANQRALSRQDLERYAQQVGLDMNRFRQALDRETHKAKIQQDQQMAAQFGARGTPAFFINGRQLMGAQPFEAFKTVIDEELKKAEALVRGGTDKEDVYAALTKNARTREAPPQAPGAGAAADAPPRPAQPDPGTVYRVPVGNEPRRGPADALVTIVTFSEFQCPFCKRVEPTVAQIREQYGNDVRIIWMNNPLPFHENAMPAAIAAMEAFEQGGNEKFWRMHDTLFENQQALTRPDLERYAQQVGLNMAQFRAALDNKEHEAAIRSQQETASRLGARGTPSFFINGRNLRGAQPFEAFKAVIDEELGKARAKVAAGTPKARLYEEIMRNAVAAPTAAAPSPSPSPAGAAPEADRVYQLPVPANAPREGSRTARVVIQEFSDFQCPFCSRVNPTMERVKEEYGNRIQIVWRNFPLPFHQNAMPAAEAAMEVFRQGGDEKFWRYHDVLFQNQGALERADLERYAEQLGGINMTQFRQALDTNRHRAAVQADMNAVQAAGARIGTPSFFINGRLIQGAQPFEAFKAAIDSALAAR